MALQQEFIRRFAEFMAVEQLFEFINSTFTCNIEATTEELQIELIHLQADNLLKMMFESKPLIEFYASLQSKNIQNLTKGFRKFVCCLHQLIYM